VFDQVEKSSLPRHMRLPSDLRADLWSAFRRREVRDFIIEMCAGYEDTLPELAAQYSHIACPTLIMWGEREKHFGLAQAQRLRAIIPGVELHIVPDGWHWMALHCADEIVAHIRSIIG